MKWKKRCVEALVPRHVECDSLLQKQQQIFGKILGHTVDLSASLPFAGPPADSH